MDKEVKESLIFILEAITKLSHVVITNDYDFEEMNKIYEQAEVHIFDIRDK